MIEVIIPDTNGKAHLEAVERALKTMRKALKKDERFAELQRRSQFVTNSQARKAKRSKAAATRKASASRKPKKDWTNDP